MLGIVKFSTSLPLPVTTPPSQSNESGFCSRWWCRFSPVTFSSWTLLWEITMVRKSRWLMQVQSEYVHKNTQLLDLGNQCIHVIHTCVLAVWGTWVERIGDDAKRSKNQVERSSDATSMMWSTDQYYNMTKFRYWCLTPFLLHGLCEKHISIAFIQNHKPAFIYLGRLRRQRSVSLVMWGHLLWWEHCDVWNWERKQMCLVKDKLRVSQERTLSRLELG